MIPLLRGIQTQTIVTLMTAFSILHLRNAHSVYLGAGATLAAVVGASSLISDTMHHLTRLDTKQS